MQLVYDGRVLGLLTSQELVEDEELALMPCERLIAVLAIEYVKMVA